MTNVTMTIPQTYRIQFDFHFEVTRRLLELARALPDDIYRAMSGYSHGSIHNTFCHLLGSNLFWRNVITDMPIQDGSPEDVADIEALAAMLEVEQKGWRELIATFDETRLFETFERESPWGTHTYTIWTTLQHVILHSVQHHAELARLLTDAGHSPGDIDFLWFIMGLQAQA